MLISPINQSQNSFKAVNQKYYQWAKKEASGGKRFGELLRQLSYDVLWRDIHPQDGIDTIEAINKLMNSSNEYSEHLLETFRSMLEK